MCRSTGAIPGTWLVTATPGTSRLQHTARHLQFAVGATTGKWGAGLQSYSLWHGGRVEWTPRMQDVTVHT